MGESLNGVRGLDVDAELRLVEEALEELRGGESTEKTEKVAMKELGIKRLVSPNPDAERPSFIVGYFLGITSRRPPFFSLSTGRGFSGGRTRMFSRRRLGR